MTTVTLKLEGLHCKTSGKYTLVAEFDDGTIKRYLSLPAKVAIMLEREGFKMTKHSYFDYSGVK
jgi:hypothetical protein